MLELASSLNIDAVCSSANDFAAITAAYVAEKLGLGGHDPYETATLIHQKDSFKVAVKSLGIIFPTLTTFDSEKQQRA